MLACACLHRSVTEIMTMVVLPRRANEIMKTAAKVDILVVDAVQRCFFVPFFDASFFAEVE